MRLIDADRLKEEMPVWIHGKIDEQPSIDPMKHGFWLEERIKIPNPDAMSDSDNLEVVQCRCSKCGRLLTLNHTYSTQLFRFCPGCGSKMEEVSE